MSSGTLYRASGLALLLGSLLVLIGVALRALDPGITPHPGSGYAVCLLECAGV